MASLAPALCNPCAIDQAMLRLFATPKTTAIRPSRLEDIWLLLNLKGKDNSGKGLFTTETQSRRENVQVCYFVPLSLCDSVAKFSFHRGSFFNWHGGSHRPTRADECDGVHQSNDGKSRDQANLRHLAYYDRQNNLQRRANEVERVLHSSHKMLRHLFHDAGIHGDARDSARRSHDPIDQDGDDKYGGERRQDHADGKQAHRDGDRTPRAQSGDEPGRVESAHESARAPSPIEPAVAHSAGVKHVVA